MKAKFYTNDFNRMIAATKNFVRTSQDKTIYQYIRLEFSSANSRVTAVAVDGCKMSVEHAVCECDEDFIAYMRGNIKLPNKQYAELELVKGEAIIHCGEFIFGIRQPYGESQDCEFMEWEKAFPGRPSFCIGFNGNYLLTALQAAKVSAGDSFKSPVVLEFHGEIGPVVLRTNIDDAKVVLPIRTRGSTT